MCLCGLDQENSIHWWVDHLNAPSMYQIGHTAEEAERALRSWAGKVVRKGHTHLDMIPMAAKILAAKRLNMIAICQSLINPKTTFE